MIRLNQTLVALLLGAAFGSATASALAVAAGFIFSFVQGTLETHAVMFALVVWAYITGISSVAAFVVASTLGLAWHAVAKRIGWTSQYAYWAPGAAVGLTLSLITGVLPLWNTSFSAEPNIGAAIAPWVCPFGAALGGFVGYFFWRRRRPDRDAANPGTRAS